jgi:hypothetical protein
LTLHYVVAAQKFAPQMTRNLEYLNSAAQVGHYHLVQMIQLQGDPQSRFCTSVVFPVARRAGVNKAAGCGVRLIPAHLGYWP